MRRGLTRHSDLQQSHNPKSGLTLTLYKAFRIAWGLEKDYETAALLADEISQEASEELKALNIETS